MPFKLFKLFKMLMNCVAAILCRQTSNHVDLDCLQNMGEVGANNTLAVLDARMSESELHDCSGP